jgi:serine phosphatase RsbU (regulator of sigma subunit)
LLLCLPSLTTARSVGDAGLPLGIDAGCEYSQATVAFPPGAVALLYTDGVTEAQNAEGGMFGAEQLAEILPGFSAGQNSAAQLKSFLLAHFEAYRSGGPLTDDQTFLLLQHAL